MKYRHRKLAILAAALTLFAISIPVVGHHGTGISYDSSKIFQAKAVVTEFKYANPHPQIYFEIKDDKGETVKWAAEVGTDLHQLQRTGWSRARATEALKPGTVVTLTIHPSRAGGPYGLIRGIRNEQGESVLGLERGGGGRE